MSGQAQTTGIPPHAPVFDAIVPGVSSKRTFTAASAQSAALQATTTVVRLYADQDCFILVGTNPTAVADGTNMFIPGGVEVYIGVQPAQKIAAIRSSADGNLYITEGA